MAFSSEIRVAAHRENLVVWIVFRRPAGVGIQTQSYARMWSCCVCIFFSGGFINPSSVSYEAIEDAGREGRLWERYCYSSNFGRVVVVGLGCIGLRRGPG